MREKMNERKEEILEMLKKEIEKLKKKQIKEERWNKAKAEMRRYINEKIHNKIRK